MASCFQCLFLTLSALCTTPAWPALPCTALICPQALQAVCPDLSAVHALALPEHYMRRFFLASLCVDLHHNAEALQHLQVRRQTCEKGRRGLRVRALGGKANQRGLRLKADYQSFLWLFLNPSVSPQSQCQPLHTHPAAASQGLAAEFPTSEFVVHLAALAHYNLQNFDEAQVSALGLLWREGLAQGGGWVACGGVAPWLRLLLRWRPSDPLTCAGACAGAV